MSEAIPFDQDVETEPEKNSGDGSITRYAFTLAIATAICLAIIAFMYILEQRTDSVSERLNIPERSAEQLYESANQIEILSLRKRALSNFVTAFPESEYTALALEQIDALSVQETEAFSELSDVVFSLTSTSEQKANVIEAFETRWGGGAYADDIKAMRERLSLTEAVEDTIQPVTRPARRQAELAPVANDVDLSNNSALAGAEMELAPTPILLPEEPARKVPEIIEAESDKPAKPRYPRRAQARGIEALVIVSMDIDETGKVVDARIVQPAEGRYANDFGKAALAAARRTQFNPKTIDGVPAPTNGHVQRYRFELED